MEADFVKLKFLLKMRDNNFNIVVKEHVLLSHIEATVLRETSPITRGTLKLKQYAAILRKITDY